MFKDLCLYIIYKWYITIISISYMNSQIYYTQYKLLLIPVEHKKNIHRKKKQTFNKEAYAFDAFFKNK